MKMPIRCCGLLLLLTLSPIASVADDSRFSLPPDKTYIEACNQQALRLYPGVITRMQLMQDKQQNCRMRYEIQPSDGSGWLLLCDLTTGTIIGEQKLLDDTLK